jgi:hypothetical protein
MGVLPEVSAIRELLLREPIIWERSIATACGAAPKTSELKALLTRNISSKMLAVQIR